MSTSRLVPILVHSRIDPQTPRSPNDRLCTPTANRPNAEVPIGPVASLWTLRLVVADQSERIGPSIPVHLHLVRSPFPTPAASDEPEDLDLAG